MFSSALSNERDNFFTYFKPPLRAYWDRLMLLTFNSATSGSGTAQPDSVSARQVSSSVISIRRFVSFHLSATS